MSDFNKQRLEEYTKALGLQKLQELWKNFEEETESFFAKPSSEKQNLRLKFHSLRSDALVFGLEKFSKHCAETEEMILSGMTDKNLECKIKEAQTIFNHQRKQVSAYFKESN